MTSAASSTRVRVLLFAAYADLAGCEELEVVLSSPATVGDAVRQARASSAGAGRIPERPLVALNAAHVALDAPVADGDEVALLPPMAGG
jgi:molybdopterin converting factor small subunit